MVTFCKHMASSSAAVAGQSFELYRHDPVVIGHEQTIIASGTAYTMRTVATRPAAFVIDDFLSAAECDELVASAGKKKESAGMLRQSNQTWINQGKANVSAVLKALRDRVYEFTRLPRFVIEDGEPLQVVEYHPGGHYHAHHDSVPRRLPRYLTFLYYLTDVPSGGETCFPLADTEYDEWEDDTPKGWSRIIRGAEDRWNLSYADNCHRSAYVSPQKGRAVLFYNHLSASCVEGQQWGCKLGPLDPYSLHGGCDVAEGIKWAANNWINVEDDHKRAGLKRAARKKLPIQDTIVLPHHEL